MPTGDQTVSLVGKYDTLELAITAWDGLSVTLITDEIQLVILPGGQGTQAFALIKVETAA